MIAALAVTLLVQAAPPEPSAQCLAQIATLNGDRYRPGNAAMMGAAMERYERIWFATQRRIEAQRASEEAQQEYLLAIREAEDAGKIPRGSYDVTKAQMDEDKKRLRGSTEHSDDHLAACNFPL